jgi:hypothetical protein
MYFRRIYFIAFIAPGRLLRHASSFHLFSTMQPSLRGKRPKFGTDAPNPS